MTNTFSQPSYPGKLKLLDAIAIDDRDSLPALIVAAALYEADRLVVENACVALSAHSDEVIRGNAILGFGHIARRFRAIGEGVQDIVTRGVTDSSEYVRGQAYAAADDLECFLGGAFVKE